MNISIRKAGVEDAGLIASISRETFYDTFAADNTAEDMHLFMEQQFQVNKLEAEVFNPENMFFLAYEADTPVGYFKLKISHHPDLNINGNAIELSRFYARKNSIGKGVGKAMMQHAISTAKAFNKTILWLGVWEHNTRAIKFYESFGFRKFSTQQFTLGNDLQQDWVMALNL